MKQCILIALAEGFEEIEAVTPTDVLRRAGCNVITAGIANKIVCGSHGIKITADVEWSEVADLTPNVLVLPGGMPGAKNLGEHCGLKALAQRVAETNGILAAICAAPAFTLAPWGLLKGRKATCFPGCEKSFPIDAEHQKTAVVVDGSLITASGPGVALDFSFSLVERLLDKAAVSKLQGEMQYQKSAYTTL
jgi:4-methyl-5(b-hydroxyethyl)-thiazole monophosphate biosynthesis